MTQTDKVLSNIAAIQTLIENFPMSLLDMMHGKTYTSAFEFLIDVLNACGVDTNKIINYLLSEIYGIEETVVGGIEGLTEKIKNGALEVDEQNKFMEGLEESLKTILMALLSGIFSCSAQPIIPNRMMDSNRTNVFGSPFMDSSLAKFLSGDSNSFVIPSNVIDIMGMLNICPTSSDGKLYYAVEGGDVYYKRSWLSTLSDGADDDGYRLGYEMCSTTEGLANGAVRVNYVPTDNVTEESPEYIVHYEGLNPNLLYRTNDMNAFIWYVLNKGGIQPQVEYNHMMWDSRILASKHGITRENDNEWNAWYSSKSADGEEFKLNSKQLTNKDKLYPIIQLSPRSNGLNVKIPSQRYYLPKKRNDYLEGNEEKKLYFNSTIYQFDWEYLQNIQILHPKVLLVGMIENLLGFSLSTARSTDISVTKKIIRQKLASAIKSVIESDDMETEDCYMSFSNDEFNDMLQEMLYARYTATPYNGETNKARSHDINKYIGLLDEVNSSATQEGHVSKLTKLVTEVTVTPGMEGSIAYGLDLSLDKKLLEKLIWALALPIVESIFTPQVLLLLMINFQLMGVTKLEDFMGQDYSMVLNLLLNKILGLVKSIVVFIKNKILELLLKLFYDNVLPLLAKWQMAEIMERLEYWINILTAAIACLPTFKFKRSKIISGIDNVDYADIIKEDEQTTPESTSSC